MRVDGGAGVALGVLLWGLLGDRGLGEAVCQRPLSQPGRVVVKQNVLQARQQENKFTSEEPEV